MRELETAWAESPTPQLARMVSATLASAGLYDQAILWSRRSAEHAAGGLRGWLSGDRDLADRLEAGLERDKHSAERRDATPPAKVSR